MKVVFGWLSDPFLHLVLIGTVVVAIGTGMSRRGGSQLPLEDDRCVLCSRHHEDPNACLSEKDRTSYAYQTQ